MDYEKAIPRVPVHMQHGLRAYVETGLPPGGFLSAVLANDLAGAAARADAINSARLGVYGEVLPMLPGGCWGSRDAVKEWTEKGGLNGLPNQ